MPAALSSLGRPVAATVSVLREQKRVDVFLSAAPLVLDKLPDARLAVIGNGPLLGELRAQADPRVAFIPFAPPMEGWLSGLDCFVLSSDYEAFPVAIVEALACGTPQVATDVGGTREAVTADTGVLVPPGDPVALAEAIVEVANLGGRDAASRARHAAHSDSTEWSPAPRRCTPARCARSAARTVASLSPSAPRRTECTASTPRPRISASGTGSHFDALAVGSPGPPHEPSCEAGGAHAEREPQVLADLRPPRRVGGEVHRLERAAADHVDAAVDLAAVVGPRPRAGQALAHRPAPAALRGPAPRRRTCILGHAVGAHAHGAEHAEPRILREARRRARAEARSGDQRVGVELADDVELEALERGSPVAERERRRQPRRAAGGAAGTDHVDVWEAGADVGPAHVRRRSSSTTSTLAASPS